MEWYPVQSLEQSASLKVVTQFFRSSAGLQSIVTLYNGSDISPSEKFCFAKADFNWLEYRKQIGVFVVPLLEKLKLPTRLERKLIALVEPVSQQLICWARRLTETLCRYCEEDCPEMAAIMAHARWMWDGRLDEDGSTRELLLMRAEETPPLRARQQFRLACTYFLEREPFLLWTKQEQLPVPDTWSGFDWLNENESQPEILNRLLDYEREKNSIDDSNFWCQALLYCTAERNEPGFKRCWERWRASTPHALSPTALAPFVSAFISHNSALYFYILFDTYKPLHPEIFRILWSSLSEQQLQEMFKDKIDLFQLVLEWPYQSIFLRLIRTLTWDTVDKNNYCALIQLVHSKTFPKYNLGPELFNYRQLFGDIWTISPSMHKSYFLLHNEGLIWWFNCELCEFDEWKEDLAFVSKDFSREEKGEFLNKHWTKVTYSYCNTDTWAPKLRQFVDVFLECGVNDYSPSGAKTIRNVLEEKGWFDHVSAKAAGEWLCLSEDQDEEDEEV